jgi:hypothetical protein
MLATSGHTSGHAIRAFRMLPTLQSAFLDRTEGPLGLRLLQLQVISKRQEKKVGRYCWEGTRKGAAKRNLAFKMCSGGPACCVSSTSAAHAGRNAMNSKVASLTTVLVACLFLFPCLLRLRNQRFSFMLGMVRFVRVMRVL